ncbi:DUF1660 domain-containing protein [Lactococcus lactis]|uniref:DUF1660 domain-containing protein n=1 Tax=Lactococcus lactis TaxID=1358 RepID=UPI001C1F9ADC|nr:DUF1660 domain-containing protein [Lactococcus lactis]MBU7542930.1 DUF1660 domain-containing protein [Lactococcus lactis]
MKLLCKLFGHKWRFNPMHDIRPYCDRCWIEETSIDKELDERIKSFNRSDLDESENVFPEKWLDKHMD